eukprot:6644993-Alexandrium_andersonii.AAC.1
MFPARLWGASGCQAGAWPPGATPRTSSSGGAARHHRATPLPMGARYRRWQSWPRRWATPEEAPKEPRQPERGRHAPHRAP